MSNFCDKYSVYQMGLASFTLAVTFLIDTGLGLAMPNTSSEFNSGAVP
uniref:Uncharacterized protein n=1 Tax=Rhizophora mucronata TaxID=61149 RepID=A0A2P2QIH0_RHIMU